MITVKRKEFILHRQSKQKQTILKVLKKTKSHPGARWIYEQVRQEIPRISLGTVYRNLKLLQMDGKILRFEMDMLGRFDSNTTRHYHIFCNQCGVIYDVNLSLSRTFEDKVAKETDFRITHHHLEFSGLCQNCS